MPAQTIRPAARSLLTVVVASLLAVAGLTLTPDTAAGSADHERRFVQLINQTRASAGLAPLAVHGELTAQARSWSASMAAADHLSHSPNIAAGISAPWTILGENVGVHGVDDVAQLHAAFVASPGHYQNLVDARYGYVGVGVVVTENGKIWTTHRFMALDEPATTTTAPTTTVPTTTAPPPTTAPTTTAPTAPPTTAPPTTARPTTTAPPTTRRPTTTASDTTAATTAPTTATTTGRRPAARLSTTAAITPASNTPSPSTTDATAATTSTPKTPTTRPSTSSSSEVPAIPPPPDPIQGSTSAPTTAPATTSTTPWSLPADADDGPAAGDPAALATPAVDEVGPGPADVETVEQLLIDLIAADG